MARNTTARTSTGKPSIMDRLRNRETRKTTTTHSTNPVTGSNTTTTKTKTKGAHHHNNKTHHATHGTTTTTAARHQKRKPSVGDKISGAMMKLDGTLTRRPGKKAAGTRRMHGTDGKGGHHY